MRLAGDMINDVDERGEAIVGDTLLLLINAHWEEIKFTLPKTRVEHVWQTMIDTARPDDPPKTLRGEVDQFPLFGRSLALLRTVRPEEAAQVVSPAQVETLRKEARRASVPNPHEPPLGA
jgi:glycogen operon protein